MVEMTCLGPAPSQVHCCICQVPLAGYALHLVEMTGWVIVMPSGGDGLFFCQVPVPLTGVPWQGLETKKEDD